MKTYTANHRSVREGLSLESHERLGPSLALGENGRGRVLVHVKLDNREPPEVEVSTSEYDPGTKYRRVLAAGVVQYEAGGVKRQALVAPAPGDKRVLVKVSSSGTYTRNTYGVIVAYWEEPKLVARGSGAFGDAGRLGSWADDLWIIPPGSAVWVSPAGGDKLQPRVLYHQPEGLLALWSPEDFRAQVIAPWKSAASAEERARRVALAQERNNHNLALFLAAEEVATVL